MSKRGKRSSPAKCRGEIPLYKDFIGAASKAYGEAIMSNEPNVQELVALLCHDQQDVRPVLAANRRGAENIMRATIDAYFAPGKTIREFHELVQSGTGIDLLKELQRGRSRKVAGIHHVMGAPKKTCTIFGALSSS